MSAKVLEFAAAQSAKGRPVALVTVTDTHGSSPASPGQMMAVLADGTIQGTVGGGASENHLRQLAVEAIQAGQSAFTFAFDHSEEGMVCGGGMQGYGTVVGSAPTLVVFGGGHIAQALASVALAAGFAVKVVEDRPELAGGFAPEVEYVLAGENAYGDALHLGASSYVVVCTRGHRSDAAALRFCLAAAPAPAYIGMIGSRKKVATLMEELKREDVPKQTRDSIYTPVGLDIASEKPGEIAVAIMAEVLEVKNKGRLRHKRDATGE